ncbi:MAG: hypothetical protein LBI69_00715 [Puniceicoccales bacterium]|jgi:hypothetical protein|nr:hypothetical protein [Puniceicoccales bacterium]
MTGKNNLACFMRAAQNDSLNLSISDAVDVTALLETKNGTFKTMKGMRYYFFPEKAAIDPKKVNVSEHLATIMVNFCCNSIVAFLLWLFCGYFRTSGGYDRMLNAASREKDNIQQIFNQINKPIKDNDSKNSTPHKSSDQINPSGASSKSPDLILPQNSMDSTMKPTIQQLVNDEDTVIAITQLVRSDEIIAHNDDLLDSPHFDENSNENPSPHKSSDQINSSGASSKSPDLILPQNSMNPTMESTIQQLVNDEDTVILAKDADRDQPGEAPSDVNFLAEWPYFLKLESEMELGNISHHAFRVCPLLDTESFKNNFTGKSCGPIKALLEPSDKDSPIYSTMVLKCVGGKIIARNSADENFITQGTYLLPIRNDENRTTHCFTKIQVGDDGVVADNASAVLPISSQINGMQWAGRADLIGMKDLGVVIGHKITSGTGNNDPDIANQSIRIHIANSDSCNVAAYSNVDEKTPLSMGTYFIPVGNGVNYEISVNDESGHIFVNRDINVENLTKCFNPSDGHHYLTAMYHTSAGSRYFYCENSLIDCTVSNGICTPNDPSLQLRNGIYLIVTCDDENCAANTQISVTDGRIGLPRFGRDTIIATIEKLPTPSDGIRAKVHQIDDKCALLEGNPIAVKFCINDNGNVRISTEEKDSNLPPGCYILDGDNSPQFLVGKDGLLKEPHALSRRQNHPYAIHVPDNESIIHIASVGDDGTYDLNSQAHHQVNGNKIDAKQGIYVVLNQCGKEEGGWISVGKNGELLQSTNNSSLLPFDPLGQCDKHPQFIDSSYRYLPIPISESPSTYFAENSFAFRVDSIHFRNMEINERTNSILAFPLSPPSSPPSASYPILIAFARTNDEDLMAIDHNGQPLKSGIYNIPQTDKEILEKNRKKSKEGQNTPKIKQNFHIQIEVGADGQLIQMSERERLKTSYPSGQNLPKTNIEPLDMATYNAENAPVWICATKEGKYTPQWHFVKPSRDNISGNLSFEFLDDPMGKNRPVAGSYICRTNDGKFFPIEIDASGFGVKNTSITPDSAAICNPLDCNALKNNNCLDANDNISLALARDGIGNNSQWYNSNSLIKCKLASNGAIKCYNGTPLAAGEYFVLSPSNREIALGRVNIGAHGKIDPTASPK